MRMRTRFEKYVLAMLTLAFIASACGGTSSSPSPTPPPSATVPVSLTAVDTLSPDFTRIDQALKESFTGSVAYNTPNTMKLNETVTIELLLNPSIEPSALGTQVTGGGQVVTASVQITPRMKVTLLPQDEDAFVILQMHDNPEQLIGATETTKWSWDVTAKKAGTHRLTLLINRLVTVDGEENWRLVESLRRDIEVEVTMAQRILMIDWKWIAGILITALLIPAFWCWVDQRKKQTEQTPKPKQSRKKAK